MRHLVILALICTAATRASAEDDLSKYEHWITGEVSEQHSELMFRCDKPIKGNPAGNVVYLGSSRATMHVMLPLLSKAAERHQKLRLYGVLLPVDEQSRKAPEAPSAQFIVWKLHLPNEPDELPADQKIITGPDDRVKGYKVEEVKKKP
jgi:hypothetical protein